MKWIKKGDKFLLSREELCILSDFEMCLRFSPKKWQPSGFNDKDVKKVRQDMMKALIAYATKAWAKKWTKKFIHIHKGCDNG